MIYAPVEVILQVHNVSKIALTSPGYFETLSSAEAKTVIEAIQSIKATPKAQTILFRNFDPPLRKATHQISLYERMELQIAPQGQPTATPKFGALPLTKLRVTQDSVYIPALIKYTQKSGLAPKIASYKGEFLILDGHHRFTVNLLAGRRTMPVFLYVFDSSSTPTLKTSYTAILEL